LNAPALEEILQADPYLAFNAADRLLECLGKHRAGAFNANWELEQFVRVVHGVLLAGGLERWLGKKTDGGRLRCRRSGQVRRIHMEAGHCVAEMGSCCSDRLRM
jgi:hypothetical protein